ncbi:hypothetical protein ACFO3J_09610 [Streptomyces polygonati]|uniref:Uncharacterized protein n=1 Tax=Streptomyces polygonati TaxID=1617087 RepID=A0ABV8HLL8_9ACTN
MSNGVVATAVSPPRHVTAHRKGGPGRAVRPGRGLLRAVAVLLLAVWAAAGLAAPATADDSGAVVKVFVVQDPARSGQALATLRSVATATLGDPSRAGEIFDLNKGLAQPDGGALTAPADQLHPGWILRLPADAAGPDVQLAKDSGAAPNAQDGTAGTKSGTAATTGATTTTTTTRTTLLSIPLPAALALIGAIALALVTAAIVARQRVRTALGSVGRLFARLGEPAARRRRTEARRAVGRRFAADAESVRRAYGALGEFAAAGDRPDKPVHALRVDPEGTTVWLAATETMDRPWQSVDDTRWRRPSAPGDGQWGAGGPDPTACLVRAGADTDGAPVFVDLSRLDGVLSVTGDRAVAGDVIRNLLAETARSRPDTPVTVLRTGDGAPPVALPAGLRQVTRVEERTVTPRAAAARGTILGAASRRPVRGLVVMTGTPTESEAAELAALCGPGGAGWTGLVCGEADGAHWRWHTDARGEVDIPILGVRLTVPV